MTGHIAPAAIAAAFYSGPGMRLLVNGLRTDLGAQAFDAIAKMAPQQQATWLGQFAQSHPRFQARAAEVGKQVVSQIARSMTVSNAGVANGSAE